MDIIDLIVYGLAIWRISSLFVNEAGPGNIFLKLREWAGIQFDGDMVPETFIAGVLSCTWCFSIWASFFLTAFWLISPEWSLKLSVPFAFSGIAILLDVAIKRMKI